MIELGCGILIIVSIYLVLEKANHRKLIGVILFSTSINVVLLLSGRLSNTLPPFVNNTPIKLISNPLPQALILTAIVIGLGLLIYISILLRVNNKDAE